MLIRFGDTFLNITEVVHVQINRKDNAINGATITYKNGDSVTYTESVDYLQTILDAYHVINVQKLRDRLPTSYD